MRNSKTYTVIITVLAAICIFAVIMLIFAANTIRTQDRTLMENEIAIVQMRDYIDNFEQQLIIEVQNEEQ